MILVREAKLEECLKIISENSYSQNLIWNNIIRYKVALRWVASTEVANEEKSEGKNKLTDSLLESFFNQNLCAEKVINEIALPIPPNIYKICQALETGNAAPNTHNSSTNYANELRVEAMENPITLKHHKFIGDLYSAMKQKSNNSEFNRKIYEEAFAEAAQENGGFFDVCLNTYKYLFGIKKDKISEITTTHASKIKELLQSTEIEKERLEKFIHLAECDWYQMVCGR